jgi:hypothetical protein
VEDWRDETVTVAQCVRGLVDVLDNYAEGASLKRVATPNAESALITDIDPKPTLRLRPEINSNFGFVGMPTTDTTPTPDQLKSVDTGGSPHQVQVEESRNPFAAQLDSVQKALEISQFVEASVFRQDLCDYFVRLSKLVNSTVAENERVQLEYAVYITEG